MDRATLHQLVDSLPEGAVPNAKLMLEQLQKWRPLPPEVEQQLQINIERQKRVVQARHRGTLRGSFAAGAGSGSFHPPDDRGFGHAGHTYWEEDQTVVHETVYFFKGHELVVTEKLRLGEEGKSLNYSTEVQGPKGGPIAHEMRLEI